jgi:DNA-binding response OmpR family regulator
MALGRFCNWLFETDDLPARQPKRLLVVEDELPVRRLIETNLRRAGYAVSSAENALEALRTAKAERPDAIILDQTLPDLDGRDLLAALRADPEIREIPVLLLAASRAQEWEPDGAAPDAALVKPLNPMELLVRVRRLFPDLPDEPGGRLLIDPF